MVENHRILTRLNSGHCHFSLWLRVNIVNDFSPPIVTIRWSTQSCKPFFMPFSVGGSLGGPIFFCLGIERPSTSKPDHAPLDNKSGLLIQFQFQSATPPDSNLGVRGRVPAKAVTLETQMSHQYAHFH